MKKVIAYSGGIDSTARAIQLLREHPEVEWTLCFFNFGQTSATKQKEALAEMLRRHPEFKSHEIILDMGFNPTSVLPSGAVIQCEGVLPLLWAAVARYAKEIGADEVYTGYDRWTQIMETSYNNLVSGQLRVESIPVNHFGGTAHTVQSTLEETGCTWADVDFTVSCAGDPDDIKNIDKVPCGHCHKCIEREELNA